MYLHQRETIAWNSESVPPALGWREHGAWPQKTITVSCDFLIGSKKCSSRPSHNLLMTSSTFKCQVLISTTLPLRGIISLMRNTGHHLHPRTCDTWEVLSPPTWNLLHIKHAEVKLNIPQPKNQSWANGPWENQHGHTVTELLAHRAPGTKGVAEKDWMERGREINNFELVTLSSVLYVWCIF